MQLFFAEVGRKCIITTMNGKIYILCPDMKQSCGGVKQLYRHVDVLNKHGFDAFILHSKKGFRCTWFHNDTRIVYKKYFLKSGIFSKLVTSSGVKINKNDYLCIPEAYGVNIKNVKEKAKKVILNQNPFYAFNGYSRNNRAVKIPYNNENVVATIVFSEHNLSYMRYIFPRIELCRVHYGFDPKLFNNNLRKKKQIAFMSRKLTNDVTQLVNILKARGTLKDFKLVEINNAKEEKVAEILRESLIFLSFSHREGFGMPSAEAMASGCIVIGYDGEGGKEFFKDDFCYPIREGDLIDFARTIEKVIEEYEDNKENFSKKSRKASEFILKNYSLEIEERDIVFAWNKILGEF